MDSLLGSRAVNVKIDVTRSSIGFCIYVSNSSSSATFSWWSEIPFTLSAAHTVLNTPGIDISRSDEGRRSRTELAGHTVSDQNTSTLRADGLMMEAMA